MAEVRVIDEATIRDVMRLDRALVERIRGALVASVGTELVQPPVQQLNVAPHGGQTCIKSAWLASSAEAVVKVAAFYPNNQARGEPASSGLMSLWDAETGRCRAVLLDNGYLNQLRTAAAGAVAADLLARPDAASAAVFGTGRQAALQLQALLLVREVERVLVFSRRNDRGRLFADQLGADLGIEVELATDPHQATACDVIVTATPSRAPVLAGELLRAGHHVTAMGADAVGKRELDEAAVRRADVYACDSIPQCRTLGELQYPVSPGEPSPRPVALADLAAGRAPGRTRADQVTVADLTGIGLFDLAIAQDVVRRLG